MITTFNSAPADLRHHLESCIALLENGELRAEDLRAAIEVLDARKIQDLLYLQCFDDSLYSSIQGIALIENGARRDIPVSSEEWPYHSAMDAIKDGWRVIRFPDAVPNDERSCGLGCEFILEK